MPYCSLSFLAISLAFKDGQYKIVKSYQFRSYLSSVNDFFISQKVRYIKSSIFS